MAALRDGLYMQMRSLHSQYDCVRKVMVRNPDLQKLPVKQAKGAIQKLWCDWTYSDLSSKEAQKVVSRENARRMIDTSDMLRQDCMDAYQDGRLSVYMEEVVRRLERLQKNVSEEEQTSKLFTKRKQEIWDEQYLSHHKHLEDRKGRYEAGFIIEEILGPRPETPLLDDIATEEQL